MCSSHTAKELNLKFNQLYRRQCNLYHTYAAACHLSDTAFSILYCLCETEADEHTTPFTQHELAELCSLPRGFLAAAGEAEVTETIQKLQPAAIVHAAALSDTGYCAQHPEEAHRANVELPVWVAKAACASGAKLLAFSSDQVYAGITQPGPLPETLPLQPINVYGRCKLEDRKSVV